MAISPYTTIDEYYTQYDENYIERMQLIRNMVKELVPEAVEKIAWGMPSFHYHGYYVIQFAACKNHIGFYPGPDAIEHFKPRLSTYKTTKGSIHLPMNKDIDMDLVKDIILYNSQD